MYVSIRKYKNNCKRAIIQYFLNCKFNKNAYKIVNFNIWFLTFALFCGKI